MHGHSFYTYRVEGLRKLKWLFAVLVIFGLSELAAGIFAKSLALIGDAGHFLLSDALFVGLTYLGGKLVLRQARGQRTYGLIRIEVFLTVANVAVLLIMFGLLMWGAFLQKHEEAPVGWIMAPVALVGIAVASGAYRWLHPEHKLIHIESLRLELFTDVGSSSAAFLAGLGILTTQWRGWDLLAVIVIAVLISRRAWILARDAVEILLEAAPRGLDVTALQQALEGVRGVREIHDLHVSTLTKEVYRVEAHAVTGRADLQQAILVELIQVAQKNMRTALGDGIVIHPTIQVECPKIKEDLLI